ncbi:hypothetical protein FRB99_001058 [Tulasnella sp. 403]|nr:hypothetical protein FRB99_001058 [Tulasnella sp. 403]
MNSPKAPSTDEDVSEALQTLRLSMDSARGNSTTNGINGHDSNTAFDAASVAPNGTGGEDPASVIERLQQELERTRAEKETLGDQYRGLLAKLTTMRTTLGNKLREDAEELDRREQLVQQLTAQNDELAETVATLKNELVLASNESQKLSDELSVMRNKAVEDSAHEASIRERQILELQKELEMCRTERDEWESTAQQESVAADEVRTLLATVRRDLEMEQAEREKDARDLEMEREKSANLQSVLEDFQAAKETEIRQAAGTLEVQLHHATQNLAEFKSRALRAEADLMENSSAARRLSDLEHELREKNALIGKLRHETVIANEHLTEALRRLRKSASDENVDRRLVSNVLLSYLATARGDSKRFEMLSLIASILSWSDTEREMAGLQRSATPGTQPAGRKSLAGVRQAPESTKVDESESFSKMWVEFLLKEAAQGIADASPTTSKPPSTSSLMSPASGLWSPGGLRSPAPNSRMPPLPSYSQASSPGPAFTTLGTPPPSRKKDLS